MTRGAIDTARRLASACAAAAAAVSVLVACSGGGTSSAVVVRDSAGVTIVESHEAQWGEGEGWRLSDEPVVTIGVEEGPEEYSLYQVRGAIRLPDGRIVIANNGSDQLRFYGSDGAYLYSVGQDGYGPGEFKIMSGMWRVGDTLVINDRGQDRVSVFSSDGEYARTVMLHREPGTGAPNAAGVFSGGSVLGWQLVFDRDRVRNEGLNFVEPNIALWRYSPDGEVLDSLGVFFFAELMSEMLESRTDEATGIAYGSGVSSSTPFGRQAWWASSGEHAYYGSSHSYEILVLGMDGMLERIIRRPIPNEPVTPNDIEQFRNDFVDEDSRFASWQRRRVNELEYPATKPAYGRLTVDALGHVWVSEYESEKDDLYHEWTVFDPEGRMLGVVQVPERGRITEIGKDYLLGIWRTELDVEQVRMLRLSR